jgi:hypothetical protein
MDIFGSVLIVLLTPLHEKHVLMRGDLDLVALEPSDCQGDAIAIVTEPFEVERGIVFSSAVAGAFEQVKQPIEADGRAAIRRKVKISHCPNLHMSVSNMRGSAGQTLEQPNPIRRWTGKMLDRRLDPSSLPCRFLLETTRIPRPPIIARRQVARA